MITGEAKANLDRAMESFIEDEVNHRMKTLSVHMILDGELIDADVCDISDGEIYVEIRTPLYFPETGKLGVVSIEMPKRMAV